MSAQPAFRINDEAVTAPAFYAAACDPRRSITVEACAGAGKTWMLISRIIRALLDEEDSGRPCQPQEVLAITFTRKAAGEMRQRLNEWLEEFAQADPARLLSALQERGVVGLDDPDRAQRLCQRLRGLHEQVLASGRSVQFRTFHAWFANLLRMAPVAVLERLGLPLRYELLEDDSGAMEAVWPRFLQALAEQPDRRADFEALVREQGRHQAHKALEAALARRSEFERADAAGVVASSVRRFQEEFPRYAKAPDVAAVLSFEPEAGQLRAAAQILQGLAGKTFVEKGHQLQAALSQQDLAGVLKSLLTDDGTPRLFGKAQSDPVLRQAGSLALQLQAMQEQDRAWHFQQRMRALSRVLIDEFGRLKRERGWIDMQDIESAAYELLSDELVSGWIQERLDAQVRHLLVDEFQDTNPLQWQALKCWLSSYAGAARAISVFLVGDPKQSIYRFRRAEPEVWRSAVAFLGRVFGADRLDCDHTRRNAQAVLAAVNQVMEEAGRDDGYPGFRSHTTAAQERGGVLVLPVVSAQAPEGSSDGLRWRDSLHQPRWLPEEKLRDTEARQAASWLAAHLQEQGLRPSEVMVLSRKRENLKPVQQALLAQGIAADIDEPIDLMDCCEVQDLVALLDVLVSPGHDLSLARALRSPLFGLDHPDLLLLAQAARHSGRSWLMTLLDAASGARPGTEPLSPALLSAAVVLGRWQSWVRELPPHDALQAVLEDGDVLARYAQAAPPLQREAVLARLQALLMQSLAIEGGRYLTAYALVRAFKAGRIKAPAVSRAEAVRLLTVHSAKGLEAQTVLIINGDAPGRPSQNMSVLVQWPGEQIHPSRFVFLISQSRPPSCCQDLVSEERRAEDREELNVVYVAMTRARRHLVLSASEPHRDSGRTLWKRLSPHADPATLPECRSPDRLAFPATELLTLPVLPQAPVAPIRSAAALPPDPRDPERALIGQAMHRLLQWGQVGQTQIDAVGRELGLDPAQSLRASEAARAILGGEGAWLWQSEQLRWQGNEVELVHEGRLQRIDRLVQHRDGTWWVIDHKSSFNPQEQPERLAQLRAYIRAVAALYPGAPVRSAFLTPEGRLIEVAAVP